MSNENNKVDINKHEIDIDTLFKQNVNDLSAIKELYRKLQEVEERISQIKYIDSTLAYRLKNDYEKLKRIILDENVQATLSNEIETINEKLSNEIETINVKLTDDIETINSQMDIVDNKQVSIFEMLNNEKFEQKFGVHYYDYHNVVNIANGTDTTSLGKIKETGFKYVRFLMEWKFIERAKKSYDFEIWDTFIDKLLENDLIPYIYIGEEPNENLDLSYSETLTHFEIFCDVVTTRYKNKNICWEIFNEPNITFWFDKKGNTVQDAKDYANMVKNVSAIIRNNDKTGKIIGGVIACANDYTTNNDNIQYWSKYIEYICEEGILDYIDYFSFHPYKLIDKPELYITKVHYQIKAILSKYSNKDIPLIISEFGYSLTKISSNLQANFLTRALCIFDMLNIKLVNVFNWNDTGSDTTEIDRNFGIIHFNGTPKPAHQKIKNLISELKGYKFIERVITSDNIFILKYCNSDLNLKYVYWCDNGSYNYKIDNIDLSLTEYVQVIDTNKKYNDTIKNPIMKNKEVEMLKRYGLEIITRELTTEDDINDIKSNGLYYCSNAKNSPVENCVIQHIGENIVWGNSVQLAFDNWSSDIYVRARRFDGSVTTFTNWSKLIRDDDIEQFNLTTHEENITLSNCQGSINLKAITVKDRTHIALQGELTGLTAESSGTTIAVIPEKYRTRLWAIAIGVNTSNWEDVNPMIQFVDNGNIDILIRGTSTLKSTDKILFNISYIR